MTSLKMTKISTYSTIYNVFVIVAIINCVNCNTIKFEGKIAGNRTISECVNGYKSSLNIRDPKMYITTSQYARKEGYPAEEHVVKTDDGYILTLHRIPGQPGAPPVFLQHGLFCSSIDWLIMGKENTLAFKLADAGYDVWMGNFRGNTYSRCHTEHTTSSYEFWDFSWHEMGIYDLPAMITYVTNVTNQKIIYIGHSMGTTAFFVMSIERPDIASKVKVMFALAPVVFMNHSTSPLRLLAPFTRLMELFLKFKKTGEFLSQSHAFKTLTKYVCTLTTLQRKICSRMIFFATGYIPKQFNYTLIPDIMYHVPAGSSVKVLVHYFQEYNSGRFRRYDYGKEKNSILYNSSTPTDYDISKITVPVGLIWSDRDVFANPIDVIRLHKQLPNSILNYRVEHSNFNHIDYLFAIDAPKYVYEKLLTFVENYKFETK